MSHMTLQEELELQSRYTELLRAARDASVLIDDLEARLEESPSWDEVDEDGNALDGDEDNNTVEFTRVCAALSHAIRPSEILGESEVE